MVGLNTYTYTVVNTGIHTAKIETDIRASSNITVTISQSGSVSATLATGTVQPTILPNTTSRSSLILLGLANCAIGDVISFVITSSTPIDQDLNTVKATFRVNAGLTN